MTLDLEGDNVLVLETTVEEVRGDDFVANDGFVTALDEAQAVVFQGQNDVAYLVIKIVK